MAKKTVVGLKAKIEIRCETEDELLAHLSVIRREMKRKIRQQKGEITKRIAYQDNNCYGEHIVIVNLDRELLESL